MRTAPSAASCWTGRGPPWRERFCFPGRPAAVRGLALAGVPAGGGACADGDGLGSASCLGEPRRPRKDGPRGRRAKREAGGGAGARMGVCFAGLPGPRAPSRREAAPRDASCGWSATAVHGFRPVACCGCGGCCCCRRRLAVAHGRPLPSCARMCMHVICAYPVRTSSPPLANKLPWGRRLVSPRDGGPMRQRLGPCQPTRRATSRRRSGQRPGLARPPTSATSATSQLSQPHNPIADRQTGQPPARPPAQP